MSEEKKELANVATTKFSQFVPGGSIQAGDIGVGLRGGVNTQFNLPATTDNLPQGQNNQYATNDGGTTDNLAALPTITGLQDQIDNIPPSPSTTDALPQGVQHIYATIDGGITDNLANLPTITGLQDQIDNLPPNPSTTDELPQGTNHWYATEDGGTTDNLASLPTIMNLQGQIDGAVTSVNGQSGTVVLDSDDLSQGTQNIYATTDGGVTDNLLSLPTITDLQTQLDGKLAQAANLADVNDVIQSRANLGIGTGTLILDQDQDYILQNPPSKNIVINMPTADHTVDLWPVNVPGSLELGEQVFIKSSPTSGNVFIRDENGVTITEVTAGQSWIAEYVGESLQPPTGWYLRQITSSGSTGDMQDTYNAGSVVAMNEGQPIQFNAGEQIIGSPLNLCTLYSNALAPAPSASAVIGMSFTMTQNGVISALGYADTAFSSGTRPVGLWLFLTNTAGTLLATANVAKTDPLDTKTGKWRMQAITPVSVSKGTRYVIAELNPTTDPWLSYQGNTPAFAVVDGWSQNNFFSPALVYPPIINNLTTCTQWGNANLEFQSVTGYSTSVQINDKTSSIAAFRVMTYDQVTQPFGIGTTSQRDAINTSLLFEGCCWSNTDSGAIERWSATQSAWLPLSIGDVPVNAATYTLKNNANHRCNYSSGKIMFSLPATAPAGTILRVIGNEGTGWRITNSGLTQLVVGSSSTGMGTGYVESANPNACIEFICTLQDTKWTAFGQSGPISVST